MTVRDFGRTDGVARDLRESPCLMELDLAAVPDGVYALEAGLFDGETSLGAVRLGLVLQQGLDARRPRPRRCARTSGIRATTSAISTAVASAAGRSTSGLN